MVPGFLGKIGSGAFLHARTEGMPSHTFPHLHFHIFGESVVDLRLVEQSSIQGSTGFWRLPENWSARLTARIQDRTDSGRDWTCRLVPASGVFCQSGGLFLTQTLRIRRPVSTLKPLHIVIHSLICSTRVATCGTRFSPKNHATVEMAHARVFAHHRAHFEVFAHRIDLCGGRSLRSMAMDLNRLHACHREFFRLRADLAQTINSLGPAFAFPYSFPLVGCTFPFSRGGFDHQVGV